MESPEISIIVPIYNTEKFLPRCFDSILKQTFTNFECILIDDGSRDKSLVICENYRQQDDRIIVAHQENSGVSIARNKGLEIARGKYVCFIDSDDYIEKNMLEKLVVAINNANTEVACCGYTEDNKVRPLCNEDFIFSKSSTTEIVHYLEMRQAFGIVVNKIYKKAIIDTHAIKFSELIKFGEDMLFSLQYFRYVKTAYISSHCLYYYLHENPNAITKSKMTFDEMNFRFDTVTKILMYIDNNVKSALYSELLAKDFIYTIALLFRLYTEQKRTEERLEIVNKLKNFYRENRAKNKFRTLMVAGTYKMLIYLPPRLFGKIFSLIYLTYIAFVKIGLGKSRFIQK